jgi:hypothetical protein
VERWGRVKRQGETDAFGGWSATAGGLRRRGVIGGDSRFEAMGGNKLFFLANKEFEKVRGLFKDCVWTSIAGS